MPYKSQPDLLEPDFADHFNKWKANPDPINTDSVLKAVTPITDNAMRTYIGVNASPNIKSRTKLLTIDALNKYDPTKSKLRTHLMSQLQSLRRMGAQENQILSVPEKVALDQFHLRESEAELKDTLGRDPTDVELADHTGLPPSRLKHIRKARGVLAQGQVEMRKSDDGEDLYDPSTMGSRVPKAWLQFVSGDLGPTDQKIMELSLGMNGRQPMQNKDIAFKLGLTPGAVSQRRAKIQQLLDMREQLGIL